MVSACALWGRRAIRRLRREERGSSTVDFIVALPMLIAVLVFAAEYGRILQLQSALEKSAGDAAMALSLLPLNRGACDFPNVDEVHLARTMIETKMRTGNADEALTVDVDVTCGVAGGEFRAPFDRIRVTGTWQPDLPLLRLLAQLDFQNSGNIQGVFSVTAQVFARHSGIGT